MHIYCAVRVFSGNNFDPFKTKQWNVQWYGFVQTGLCPLNQVHVCDWPYVTEWVWSVTL